MTTKDLAEALRELIALKDLKEGAMERSIKASMSKGANPSERYHEWNADYQRRKPLAWEAARAALASHDAAQSAGEAQAVPVAWLHTVVQNEDGEEDMALSFAPDNFPLMGEAPGFFQSIKHEPLYTHPAAPPSPAVERDERALFEAWMGPEAFLARGTNGGYIDLRAGLYWSAWQARAALEGEKP